MCELDGSVFDRPFAAFRVIPYFARSTITLPDLDSFIDIPATRLRDLEGSEEVDPESEDVELDLEELGEDDEHEGVGSLDEEE